MCRLCSSRGTVQDEGATEEVFAKYAQQRSDCGSFQNGGDLGKFGPGDMQKQFEDGTKYVAALATPKKNLLLPIADDARAHTCRLSIAANLSGIICAWTQGYTDRHNVRRGALGLGVSPDLPDGLSASRDALPSTSAAKAGPGATADDATRLQAPADGTFDPARGSGPVAVGH